MLHNLSRVILASIFFLSFALPPGVTLRAAAPIDNAPTSQVENGAFAPDRLLLKLHPAVVGQLHLENGAYADRQVFAALLLGVQVRSARQLFREGEIGTGPSVDRLEGIYRLDLAKGSDVLAAVAALSANAAVEWAEPDYLAHPIATPDDPLFSLQWGLSQIEASAAWDISTGSAALPIALIDSGLDFDHPDMASKIWTNAGEVAGNGLDDDANGYTDDLHGWDFVIGDNDPADDNGHGTQTSGVASAAADNGAGIAGVCWYCTLMPVKVMDAGGVANYSDIAAGVLYAARKGARVINISLGGYSQSAALLTAIQAAVEDYDAVIVAGAGNDHLSTPFYPAAYEQVLAVAASGAGDILWGSSNFGDWVNLVAPGVNIQTTFLGGDYGAVDGTSLSTAFVSGLTGLLRSQHMDWSAEMARAQIIHTAEVIDSLNPAFAGLLGSGRVNAYQALSTAPQPLLSFQSQTVNGSSTTRPEPGSSVDLQVSMYNDWADAGNVQATLSSSDPYVSIVTPGTSYGDIAAYASATNATPFQFDIVPGAPFGYTILMQLHITAGSGYAVDIPISVQTASAITYPPATITTQTWTNDRIYVINKESGIPGGNTLTIEPGTQVRFDGDYTLTVQGALVADGALEQPIEFIASQAGQGQIQFADSSLDATFDGEGNYLSGSILRYSRFDSLRKIYLNIAAPYISGNEFIEIPEGIYVIVTPGLVISYNELSNCLVFLNGGVGPAHILGNKFAGEGISAAVMGIEITANRLSNAGMNLFQQMDMNINGNLLCGLAISDDLGALGSITVTHNTILSCDQRVISLNNATALIQHNNLLKQGAGYALQNNASTTVDATQNWWGTVIPTEIEAAIYDGLDEFGLGMVDTSDYLTSPEPDAPAYVTGVDISPDTTLGIQTATFDLQFNRPMDATIAPEILFQSTRLHTWTYFDPTSTGLPDNGVSSIYSAPDGSVWVGTWGGGALRYDGTSWTVFNTGNSGLPADNVTSFTSTSAGTIWIGTINGAVRFDGTSWTVFNSGNSGLPDNVITSLSSAPAGTLWFATSAGAARYDGNNWTVFNADNSGLPDSDIKFVHAAANGAVWFSTWAGVVRYDGANWTVFDEGILNLPANYSTSITSSPDGGVWVGTGAGAARYDGADWIFFDTSNSGLPNNSVLSLSGASDGAVWIATEGGVASFDGTTWESFNTSNSGLPIDRISAIAATPDGPIWTGSGSGVTVYWILPTYTPDSGAWLDADTYRATLEVTSLIRRDEYLTQISGAVGTDGIEIAPVADYPFTVDYAGAISDSTPPPAPTVRLCAGETLSSISASWSAFDPQSAITLYSYAIGSSPGGVDVVNWTSTAATSMSRTDLNLIAGQRYSIAVKARNTGGLWSEIAIPPGVLAGSGVCATNEWRVFLPKLE